MFTELDLNKAFHQIELHPDAWCYTVLSTPMGLIRCVRLPMGLASASEILQGAMDNALSGLEGVKQRPHLLATTKYPSHSNTGRNSSFSVRLDRSVRTAAQRRLPPGYRGPAHQISRGSYSELNQLSHGHNTPASSFQPLRYSRDPHDGQWSSIYVRGVLPVSAPIRHPPPNIDTLVTRGQRRRRTSQPQHRQDPSSSRSRGYRQVVSTGQVAAGLSKYPAHCNEKVPS